MELLGHALNMYANAKQTAKIFVCRNENWVTGVEEIRLLLILVM